MHYINFFNSMKLLEPLSEEELKNNFELYKNGNIESRDILIKHNLKLVTAIVIRYNQSKYDLDELAEVGVIGLTKAIDTFDILNGAKFSTYAGMCIGNEINMFLRKVRKDENNISIEESAVTDKNGNEQTLENTLSDNSDLMLDYEGKEQILIIRKLVDELPNPIREIIKLTFGFDGERQHTQIELAVMYGFSQVQISRIIKKTINILAKELYKLGIIDSTKKINRSHKEQKKKK